MNDIMAFFERAMRAREALPKPSAEIVVLREAERTAATEKDLEKVRYILKKAEPSKIEGREEGAFFDLLPEAKEIGIEILKEAARTMAKSRIDFYAITNRRKLNGIALDTEVAMFENSFGHIRRNSVVGYVDGEGIETHLGPLRFFGGRGLTKAFYEIEQSELRNAATRVVSERTSENEIVKRCKSLQLQQIDRIQEKEPLWLFMLSIVNSETGKEFEDFLRIV